MVENFSDFTQMFEVGSGMWKNLSSFKYYNKQLEQNKTYIVFARLFINSVSYGNLFFFALNSQIHYAINQFNKQHFTLSASSFLFARSLVCLSDCVCLYTCVYICLYVFSCVFMCVCLCVCVCGFLTISLFVVVLSFCILSSFVCLCLSLSVFLFSYIHLLI